ncbi:MAG: hypothetical protein WBE82_18230, partial [Xanthobacteraceae bacterium]
TTIAHSRAPWACRLKITSMPLWRAWARRRNAISQPFVALRNGQHTIALNLTLHEGDKRQEFSVEQMADAIDVAEVANLVAAPGTGKSTTMVQLAGAILNSGRAVPALVPLGEWSALRENFFSFLTRRNAYGAFPATALHATGLQWASAAAARWME